MLQLIAHWNERAHGPQSKVPVQCEVALDTAEDIVNNAESDVPSVSRKCDYNKSVKSAVRKHMNAEHDTKCLEKVKALVVQGKTLELAATESTDFTWKSFVYDLRASAHHSV